MNDFDLEEFSGFALSIFLTVVIIGFMSVGIVPINVLSVVTTILMVIEIVLHISLEHDWIEKGKLKLLSSERVLDLFQMGIAVCVTIYVVLALIGLYQFGIVEYVAWKFVISLMAAIGLGLVGYATVLAFLAKLDHFISSWKKDKAKIIKDEKVKSDAWIKKGW